MAGGVQAAGSGQLLLGILQIEDDRHVAIKDLQQVDDLGVLRAGAGGQADVKPLRGVPHEVWFIGLRVFGVIALNGQDALRHQLGRLIFPHREAALDDDDRVFFDGVPERIQHPRENDDFHGARQVFHAGKRHHGIGFCCHHPVFDNGADDAHMGVIQYMGILPGQRFDGVGGEPRRLFPVSVQRVAGQVQAADFFFLLYSGNALIS